MSPRKAVGRLDHPVGRSQNPTAGNMALEQLNSALVGRSRLTRTSTACTSIVPLSSTGLVGAGRANRKGGKAWTWLFASKFHVLGPPYPGVGPRGCAFSGTQPFLLGVICGGKWGSQLFSGSLGGPRHGPRVQGSAGMTPRRACRALGRGEGQRARAFSSYRDLFLHLAKNKQTPGHITRVRRGHLVSSNRPPPGVERRRRNSSPGGASRLIPQGKMRPSRRPPPNRFCPASHRAERRSHLLRASTEARVEIDPGRSRALGTPHWRSATRRERGSRFPVLASAGENCVCLLAHGRPLQNNLDGRLASRRHQTGGKEGPSAVRQSPG